MMADTIIQTRKTAARKPWVSFALSFFFPGLGQMHNGDLTGGVAFALLRAVAIMVPPAWAAAGGSRSTFAVVVVFMFIIAALTLASPIEAFLRARRSGELPVRRYNAAFPYILFAAAGAVVTGIAVLVLTAFFSIAVSDGSRTGPLLSDGDIFLVNHYMPAGPRRGELALLDEGAAARVIALGGDFVSYTNNIFSVNGRNLRLGYIADDIIARLTADREDIVSETGEAGPYPVRFRQSKDITLAGVGGVVRKGTVLVAFDTRLAKDFARLVPASSVRGRVEGVLFSLNVRKIGMNAFGGLK